MIINKYLAKLLVGVRVKPSDYGQKKFRSLRGEVSGKIVGISKDTNCIRVIKDGQKTVGVYWPGYWVKE